MGRALLAAAAAAAEGDTNPVLGVVTHLTGSTAEVGTHLTGPAAEASTPCLLRMTVAGMGAHSAAGVGTHSGVPGQGEACRT